MASASRTAPSGLPMLGTAVLMTFMIILGAVLTHTLAGHTTDRESMPGMTATEGTSQVWARDHHGIPATAGHSAATPIVTAAWTLSNGVADCGGLCSFTCSLMGMACLVVLVLFAIAWLRQRSSRAMFVVSRALAAARMSARGVIPRRTAPLMALSILRI